MTKRINIPKAAIPQIALIAENSKTLGLLKKATEGIPPSGGMVAKIAKIYSAKSGVKPADARQMISQIMSFHQLRRSLGVSPSDLYSALTESLLEHPDAEKVDLKKWKTAKAAFEEVISPSHPLGVLQKYVKLIFEHQNIFETANVLTDIRPVFDDSAREIDLMTISYTLEIEYTENTVTKKFFVALDAQDITKLKLACERAQTKTVTLKEKLKTVPCPTLITGDGEDE